MKILFVCKGNLNRSPTAERVCRELAESKGLEIEVESAGLSTLTSLFSGRKLTKGTADAADKIFVMEEYMKRALVRKYSQPSKKIISLNIQDIYITDDPELINQLKRKITPYLDKIL